MQDTSSFLKIELGNIERDTGLIRNIRGNGTYLGFDCKDEETTTSVQHYLNKVGIQVARIGPHTLGLRPALICGPTHAADRKSVV